MYRQIVMPHERITFNGGWRAGDRLDVDLSNADRANVVASVTWTDAWGRHWRRDGSQSPKQLAEPWAPSNLYPA